MKGNSRRLHPIIILLLYGRSGQVFYNIFLINLNGYAPGLT